MKYFTYNQNNSGGYFIRNDEVADYVIIQASSAKEADEKMSDISYDHDSYCQCCGERWWIDSDESDGKDGPMVYKDDIRDSFEVNFDANNAYALIYNIDGTIDKILPTNRK